MLKNVVERWKSRGYDTESLNEKPEKLGQGQMKAWLGKWKKKGYDTGSISESASGKGSRQHSKNIERGYKEESE